VNRIAIIGGGASGMMAAITARENGAEVVVYESNDKIARKILSTGNGRCNFTNRYATQDKYNGRNTAFMKNAINKFWVDETLDFFERIGVIACEESDGKMYPYSRQASAVLDVLRFEAQRLGIEFRLKTKVQSVSKEGKRFLVLGEYYDKVIIATGGKAAPALGSDGLGYELSKSFGHTITKLYPTLVQIKTDLSDVKGLKGIKVQAKVSAGDKSDYGEVLFTDYGISGPPVFRISSFIKDKKEISIDFMPDYTEEQVFNILKKRSFRGLSAEKMLIGIVNRLVGINLLKYAGISPLTKPENELSDDELLSIVSALKSRKLRVVGTKEWDNAQVTAGGVNTDEVNSKTMESRLVKGLYFAGEILDIDGECGGYNLQWAWSSGYVAGQSAAR